MKRSSVARWQNGALDCASEQTGWLTGWAGVRSEWMAEGLHVEFKFCLYTKTTLPCGKSLVNVCLYVLGTRLVAAGLLKSVLHSYYTVTLWRISDSKPQELVGTIAIATGVAKVIGRVPNYTSTEDNTTPYKISFIMLM